MDYPGKLLAPFFLDVVLGPKCSSKRTFEKKSFLAVCTPKNWLRTMGAIYHAYYDDIKRFPLSFSLKYTLKKLVIISLWLSLHLWLIVLLLILEIWPHPFLGSRTSSKLKCKPVFGQIVQFCLFWIHFTHNDCVKGTYLYIFW